MTTVYDWLAAEVAARLDRDSDGLVTLPLRDASTAESRMLYALTQCVPETTSRPCLEGATVAEREGLRPVTVPLRVPLLGGSNQDMIFLGRVARDMDREWTCWYVVLEYLPGGYPGVSVWRIPHPLTKEEVAL
jgi:hypothetical protein